ncbi:hypothetical protein Pdsh_00100 [Pyrodictium delaneyi]|uniref:Uncharacterized protein n=2 Tax=Pyrodictium delaneyi TaxID=1273541 RepID=A0A211YQJ2_9CREN|nr:hypothetical protein Pdsh_00100 [Pyrodictium delaneyi]
MNTTAMDKTTASPNIEDKQRISLDTQNNKSIIDIPLDAISDAWIQHGYIYLQLANGKILSIPANKHTTSIYWEVKLRNRRRAFGL